MSRGISAIDFVKQVYYAQEKVVLDFVPTDDKFKEVLYEANFVLQELQKEEDWLWLRKQQIIGETEKDTRYFTVPEDFYKASTLFNDALRLYAHKPNSPLTVSDWDRAPFILVPWVPFGWQNDHAQRQMAVITRPNVPDITLGATIVDSTYWPEDSEEAQGQLVVFNRPLLPYEWHRLVLLQYQRLLEPFHICDDSCHADPYQVPDPEHPGQTIESTEISYDPENFHPCNQLYDGQDAKLWLREVPDPLYVIIKTAQYHAEGSPPAQGRIAGLQDQAQKMLSAMRENNAAATQVDFIPSWNPGFWQVI